MDAMAKSLCTGSDGFVFSVFCFLFSVFFFFLGPLSVFCFCLLHICVHIGTLLQSPKRKDDNLRPCCFCSCLENVLTFATVTQDPRYSLSLESL